MGWSFAKWARGVYDQIVVNERLNNNTVRSLAANSLRGFGHANLPNSNNAIPPTTAGGSVAPNSSRFYGRLPSQGDWFSPPYNPPGNQSIKD